jgi:hypothetical protein
MAIDQCDCHNWLLVAIDVLYCNKILVLQFLKNWFQYTQVIATRKKIVAICEIYCHNL